MGEVITLGLDEMVLDPDLQPRVQLVEATLAEYAEAMQAGEVFPQVVVFDDGERHWLADGFHRVHAAIRAGLTEISTDVRKGSRRDALLFAVGANATHGLRRTNYDKRRAVTLMLKDPEWTKWSDREISRQCAVSHPLGRGNDGASPLVPEYRPAPAPVRVARERHRP